MAGLLLVGLTASGLAANLPDLVRFFILFAAAAFVPGHVLATRYLRISSGNMLLDIPLSFLLGLSTISVFTWFAMIAGFSFSTYLIVLQVVLAVFFAVTIWRDRSIQRDRYGRISFPHTIDSSKARILYGLVALFLCIFFIVRGMPLDDWGDHYDHIGFVRAVALENDLNPEGVLSPPAAEDDSGMKSDPRKGTLHPFLTAVSELAQISPEAMWTYLPILLAPLIFLLFLAFTALVLPAGGYRFACVVLFLLFYGGIGAEHLSRSAYGQHLSTAYYWGLFVLCMLYARSKRLSVLIAAMILFWGGSAIHISVLPRFLLLIGALLIFPAIFPFVGKERLRLLLTVIAVTAVVALWKIMTTFQAANMIHLHPQGLLYFSADYFIVSPVEIINRYGLIFLGGIVSIPFLLFIRSRREYAKIQLALAVLPLLLCFNPILAPFVYDRGSYLLHRLAGNIPALHIAILLIGVCIAWGRSGGIIKRVLAATFVFVWALFFIKPSLLALQASLAQDAEVVTNESDEFDRVLWFFKGKGLEETVVLSDPVTSYRLSALTGVKVVAVLHQHGNPNDPHALDRLKAVRDVLSPFTSQREALAAMDKYNAQYIVCNGLYYWPRPTFLGDWDPRFFDEVKLKFESLPAGLKNVLETPRIVIYRRTAETPQKEIWHPTIPFLPATGVNLRNCGADVWDEAVVVKSAGVTPKTTLPGERVILRIAYEKLKEVDFSLPLKLYIRFDRVDLSCEMCYPGEKYVRRYRARRSGIFKRFRVDHRPFQGIYAPDIWPIGNEVAEAIPIDLPINLQPGHYTVQLKLIEDSLVPNQSYRDFLYNEDGYSGAICATMDVREFLVR
jgi:hypothetical protein